ncbi:MAG: hypothetical protein ACREOI_04590 [bacterium]
MIIPDFYYEEHEMTLEEVKAILDGFEREYGMTSEEFYAQWKKGETYWVAESVAWSGLYESYQALNGKNLADQPKVPELHVEEREMTNAEVKTILDEFERKYGMTSQEFYEKWKKGETYWVAESVEWSGFYRAYQAVNGKIVKQPKE